MQPGRKKTVDEARAPRVSFAPRRRGDVLRDFLGDVSSRGRDQEKAARKLTECFPALRANVQRSARCLHCERTVNISFRSLRGRPTYAPRHRTTVRRQRAAGRRRRPRSTTAHLHVSTMMCSAWSSGQAMVATRPEHDMGASQAAALARKHAPSQHRGPSGPCTTAGVREATQERGRLGRSAARLCSTPFTRDRRRAAGGSTLSL
ncbi:hypothetical protein PsYK624_111820 [Phanerochaete sordida]|uniref:Uncharacterized protein n=1 Tax=Phanerochaete sordida TaxID=48140 RepID=A0A9P3LHU7_9APHY|nr:hypothetical protein PsYK624_111820 [Phanerochaete sordida]